MFSREFSISFSPESSFTPVRSRHLIRFSVALAFYLPWLEIFCAVGLVFRFLYHGALSILTASIVVFTLATIAAKVRGLDITCGCFGHASQHWSFPSHLATNLAILAGLLVLSFKDMSGNRLQDRV